MRSGLRFAVGAMPSEPPMRRQVGEDVGRLVATTVSMVWLQGHAHGHGVDQHLVPASRRGTRAPPRRRSRPTSPCRAAGRWTWSPRSAACAARAASAKAKRMMRSTPARVNIDTSVPPPPAGRGARGRQRRRTRPPSSRARSPSRASGPVTLRSGLVMPGRMRVGRTLAYWSKGWQMARRRPHSVMWSGTSGRRQSRTGWRRGS